MANKAYIILHDGEYLLVGTVPYNHRKGLHLPDGTVKFRKTVE